MGSGAQNPEYDAYNPQVPSGNLPTNMPQAPAIGYQGSYGQPYDNFGLGPNTPPVAPAQPMAPQGGGKSPQQQFQGANQYGWQLNPAYAKAMGEGMGNAGRGMPPQYINRKRSDVMRDHEAMLPFVELAKQKAIDVGIADKFGLGSKSPQPQTDELQGRTGYGIRGEGQNPNLDYTTQPAPPLTNITTAQF